MKAERDTNAGPTTILGHSNNSTHVANANPFSTPVPLRKKSSHKSMKGLGGSAVQPGHSGQNQSQVHTQATQCSQGDGQPRLYRLRTMDSSPSSEYHNYSTKSSPVAQFHLPIHPGQAMHTNRSGKITPSPYPPPDKPLPAIPLDSPSSSVLSSSWTDSSTREPAYPTSLPPTYSEVRAEASYGPISNPELLMEDFASGTHDLVNILDVVLHLATTGNSACLREISTFMGAFRS